MEGNSKRTHGEQTLRGKQQWKSNLESDCLGTSGVQGSGPLEPHRCPELEWQALVPGLSSSDSAHFAHRTPRLTPLLSKYPQGLCFHCPKLLSV